MDGRGTLSLPNGHTQSGEFREGKIWRGAWMDAEGSLLGGAPHPSLPSYPLL